MAKGDVPRHDVFHAIKNFAGNYNTTLKELLNILLIFLLMRAFRRFIFNCPCAPIDSPVITNRAGVVSSVATGNVISRDYYDEHLTENGTYDRYRNRYVAPVGAAGVVHHDPTFYARDDRPAWLSHIRPLKLSSDQYEKTRRYPAANRRLRRIYSLLFLLLPAICLFLLKLIIKNELWRHVTGLFRKESTTGVTVREDGTQVKVTQQHGGIGHKIPHIGKALLSASIPAWEWILISLLDGKFLTCGYSVKPCDPNYLHTRQVRAKSQMIGWILLLTLAFALLFVKLFKSLCSKMNFYERRFADIYKWKEANEFERLSRRNAKSLAVRHVDAYFHENARKPNWWHRVGPSMEFKEHLTAPTDYYYEQHSYPASGKVDTAYRPLTNVSERSGYDISTSTSGRPVDETTHFITTTIGTGHHNTGGATTYTVSSPIKTTTNAPHISTGITVTTTST